MSKHHGSYPLVETYQKQSIFQQTQKSDDAIKLLHIKDDMPNEGGVSLIEVALFLSDAYEPEYFKEIVEKMRDKPTWQSYILIEPTEGYILSACVLCEHVYPEDVQDGPVVELRYLASLEDKHLLDLVNKLK